MPSTIQRADKKHRMPFPPSSQKANNAKTVVQVYAVDPLGMVAHLVWATFIAKMALNNIFSTRHIQYNKQQLHGSLNQKSQF